MAYQLTDFLPTTKKECELRGWDQLDVIIFSGDAYVDHPSFGQAVIGRSLEAAGYKVAIVPQPDWHGDYRDFKKLGRPRLCFAISPGVMDSMVNKYTAGKRLRSQDEYSPDGRHDCRPEYPTIVYTRILKQLFPDVPVVLGGVEASMRRLTHYDYWQDRLRKCILCDSGADLILYGMGAKSIIELCHQLEEGLPIKAIHNIPQTVYLAEKENIDGGITDNDIVLHSHEECLQSKKKEAENYKYIEEAANMKHAHRLLQGVDGTYAVVNPPYPTLTTPELDASFDLPYTRQPHPKYRGKVIPAYEMIKFSINIHQGCFGGCAFCTISAHQGKFVTCRSKKSILKEAEQVVHMPGFKGYISDLGGPSANMYGMHGRNEKACEVCKRPSCINPQVCPNLITDHSKLLEIYHAVDALPEVKKSFVSSGIRYDLLLHQSKDEEINKSTRQYTRELIAKHVSGRLKIAPEHTSPQVLKLMRKPDFSEFYDFKRIFDQINKEEGLKEQLIPYFISSHPGCHEADMAELAVITKDLNFHLEQVQDFTPTPMTISTEMWYTGYNPYTLEPVYSAKTPNEKKAQRQFFFWYLPEERRNIEHELRRIGRSDLIERLYSKGEHLQRNQSQQNRHVHFDDRPVGGGFEWKKASSKTGRDHSRPSHFSQQTAKAEDRRRTEKSDSRHNSYSFRDHNYLPEDEFNHTRGQKSRNQTKGKGNHEYSGKQDNRKKNSGDLRGRNRYHR